MAAEDIAFTSESGNIVGITYDSETEELVVSFNHGGVYSYHGVPETTARGFESAPSAGSWLNGQVKGLYPYTKL